MFGITSPSSRARPVSRSTSTGNYKTAGRLSKTSWIRTLAIFRIGANAIEGAHLNGLIDEVGIYDRALSATEIQAIFLAGSRGKCKVATVLIDIKPGSFPNSINPKSKGVIPVAIRTTGAFDATTVNPTTVRFGRTGTEAAAVHSALEEDMILHFDTQETGIKCGGTSASLTGQTLGGKAIEGSDSIQTVGCK